MKKLLLFLLLISCDLSPKYHRGQSLEVTTNFYKGYKGIALKYINSGSCGFFPFRRPEYMIEFEPYDWVWFCEQDLKPTEKE